MDIYFDFEATQFSERIIAIGATCDYGDFDCLVSSFKKKVTPLITQLTGITKEMLEGAPTANDAFIDLWQWIAHVNEGGEPVFYHCYGESDRTFLLNTAAKMEENAMSRFVRKLADSMIDDSKTVCRFFHTKAIGVHKALKYFEPEIPDQDHDSLNDAILLKRLMEHIDKAEPLNEYPFVENDKIIKVVVPQSSNSGYLITAISLTDMVMKPRFFNTYSEACDWLYPRIKKKSPKAVRDNILKRMKKAIDETSDYGGFHWIKEVC